VNAASRRLLLPGDYGHFFRPPVDVSLFWPGEHLPEPFVSGFPAPGPSFIAASAGADAVANAAVAKSSAVSLRAFLMSPPSMRSLACGTAP
jgi:hypothetical protein